jgi:hypothetical protein
MTTRSFSQDFKVGTSAEIRNKEIFEKAFQVTLNRTPHGHRFDYEGDDILIELKKRNNGKTTYPTTMIPTSKCTFADTQTKDCIFAFEFNDGSIWYITYDKDLFDTFVRKDFQRPDRVDHVDKEQSYTYIPVILLDCIRKPVHHDSPISRIPLF